MLVLADERLQCWWEGGEAVGALTGPTVTRGRPPARRHPGDERTH